MLTLFCDFLIRPEGFNQKDKKPVKKGAKAIDRFHFRGIHCSGRFPD